MKDRNLNLEILIITYLREYSFMEKNIKELFEKNISNIDSEKMLSLYYIYGIHEFSTNIIFNFEHSTITLDKMTFKKENVFKKFNLKKILDIIYNYNLINDFPKEMNTFQSRTKINLIDIFKKLTLLRNILAHETGYINLGTKQEIESFSKDNLKKYISDIVNESEVNKFDENQMLIASSICYVRKINNILNSLKSNE